MKSWKSNAAILEKNNQQKMILQIMKGLQYIKVQMIIKRRNKYFSVVSSFSDLNKSVSIVSGKLFLYSGIKSSNSL